MRSCSHSMTARGLLRRRGFGPNSWDRMTPSHEWNLLTDRLKAARKGIILLHDPKAQTAAMLPAFLRYLKDHHYRVVHLAPAAPRADLDGPVNLNQTSKSNN